MRLPAGRLVTCHRATRGSARGTPGSSRQELADQDANVLESAARDRKVPPVERREAGPDRKGPTRLASVCRADRKVRLWGESPERHLGAPSLGFYPGKETKRRRPGAVTTRSEHAWLFD